MAKLASVFKRFLHVNNSTVVEDYKEIKGDDGVVKHIFDVRPAK